MTTSHELFNFSLGWPSPHPSNPANLTVSEFVLQPSNVVLLLSSNTVFGFGHIVLAVLVVCALGWVKFHSLCPLIYRLGSISHPTLVVSHIINSRRPSPIAGGMAHSADDSPSEQSSPVPGLCSPLLCSKSDQRPTRVCAQGTGCWIKSVGRDHFFSI